MESPIVSLEGNPGWDSARTFLGVPRTYLVKEEAKAQARWGSVKCTEVCDGVRGRGRGRWEEGGESEERMEGGGGLIIALSKTKSIYKA